MRRLGDIASEAVVLAGAGRAILLQIAHPAVGYGVARHSDFAARPMSRLNGTLSYIYALSNGSEEDARLVRRAVNRAHAPVRNPPAAGEAPAEGVPAYDARDPQLQLWVAATLYDTAISVYERVYGALGPEEGERIYREYAVLGTALQMPPELWPADRAAFRDYWNETLAGLHVDATVRGVADALLRAEAAPWWVRAGMPLMRQISVALLPASVRRAFGFAWSARRQRRVDRLFAVLGPVYRMLPRAVRHWPRRHYLA
ncbi:MAG: oxygenase MpaB family protein, partial [Herbiconiux sp.]|nr:oxygenase MpaB family protein [Herbiconiux sp.]